MILFAVDHLLWAGVLGTLLGNISPFEEAEARSSYVVPRSESEQRAVAIDEDHHRTVYGPHHGEKLWPGGGLNCSDHSISNIEYQGVGILLDQTLTPTARWFKHLLTRDHPLQAVHLSIGAGLGGGKSDGVKTYTKSVHFAIASFLFHGPPTRILKTAR